MSYTVTDITGQDIVEPVDLAFQKAWSQVDQDYAAKDEIIELLITSAREALESYLNIGLVKRNVVLEWDGRLMPLPLSPNGDIASVRDNEGTAIANTDYSLYGGSNKLIAVGSYCGNANYFYNLTNQTVDITYGALERRNDVYKVIYSTGYEVLPSALKEAIAIQVDNDLKLMGQPGSTGLCSAAKAKAEPYSRNLVL